MTQSPPSMIPIQIIKKIFVGLVNSLAITSLVVFVKSIISYLHFKFPYCSCHNGIVNNATGTKQNTTEISMSTFYRR